MLLFLQHTFFFFTDTHTHTHTHTTVIPPITHLTLTHKKRTKNSKNNKWRENGEMAANLCRTKGNQVVVLLYVDPVLYERIKWWYGWTHNGLAFRSYSTFLFYFNLFIYYSILITCLSLSKKKEKERTILLSQWWSKTVLKYTITLWF